MARLRCLLVAFVVFAAALRLPGDAIASRGHHGPAAHDYRDALAKSILFFEGQRSGKLPPSQRVSWRRDSGLSDGSAAKVDLVGGYHDAGDNVKFGFPMAFSMTMLAWSVVEFGGLMKSELPHARDAVRWGADYLLKATAHPDTIYVQVGDATKDHACWERPEDMDTPRTVYKVDARTPGSDVAAETAAALAAASLVFRKSDPAYASRLVARAKRVFEFADKHRGAYSTGLAADVCPYYCSYSGYQDELLWGAAWLHRATRSATYLSYIQSNGAVLGADESDNTFGWDNKHAGARVLIAKSFLVQRQGALREYKSHADGFICSMVPGTATDQTQYTRGGLLFRLSDSNMQYVTSSAFLMLTYAKYLAFAKTTVRCGGVAVTPHRLRAVARRQVDYLLGSNPMGMSYMVGYGGRYPRRIHHRASSLPSVAAHPGRIGCSQGFTALYAGGANPNVLVGAVVGGPDMQDRFPDERNDHEHSEPATYINAPLVGALAYLAHSYGQL
ncbi:hypothetical protein BDA96_03G156900 [Sorghum bicolor]|uniref:Endoglucanase n=2 Tax=Sorghum bicolor TaxID=4558 RepID=A0A921UNG6_SORBI|nr:endoglucanase 3 [Sorghum bicolor]EES00659.1 hypothetical protein SORBI_3003G148500 [Sorghum bicolor]KAG0537535.1 hypothetical protein BDA96_03G156900 [Sorghum bicolor]|eukprot:XP_002455539.1 endoglucanase 3 [Sorghum bicolor]